MQLFNISRKDYNSHPKKELTSTPLVLSSSGAESFPAVSGMSAEDFLMLKKAWKKTNLEKTQKHQQLMVSLHKTLSSLHCSTRGRSYLATSMMRSSCFFTWWLSMIEASRATIHFLRRNMEFSLLRKES